MDNTLTTETEEPTEAFKEYMKMANNLFHNLKNDIKETPEESEIILKKQESLWEQMTDDERFYADETILRTIIDINARKEIRNENR